MRIWTRIYNLNAYDQAIFYGWVNCIGKSKYGTLNLFLNLKMIDFHYNKFQNKTLEKVNGILILSGSEDIERSLKYNQIYAGGSSNRILESLILQKKYPEAKLIYSGSSTPVNNEISNKLVELGKRHKDYVWPLPFFDGYNKQLESPIADLINAPFSPPTAGAITAGLFLKKFVENAENFLHFDIYSWQKSSEPGQTAGGKMQAVRALIEFLEIYQK